MKRVIFSLLLVTVLSDKTSVFRYVNGIFAIDNDPPRTVSGTFFIQKEGQLSALFYMGTTISTMLPFAIIAQKIDSSPEQTFTCVQGIWQNTQKMAMTGKITVREIGIGRRASGSCSTLDGKKVWTVDGEGSLDKNMLFEPKVAGRRAVDLVGLEARLYAPYHVIGYAISDMPFFLTSCSRILKKFPKEYESKPGFIIVASNGEHCGIIDHEGSKFIHANPITRAVTLSSIALIIQFFPEGYEFRSYPNVELVTDGLTDF